MALAASTDLQAALMARPSAPEAVPSSRMMSQNLKNAAAVGRSPACQSAGQTLFWIASRLLPHLVDCLSGVVLRQDGDSGRRCCQGVALCFCSRYTWQTAHK